MDKKNIKGISILESLVCLVIIGIGFVAMLQLSSFAINAMDRSLEKNKLNFLSEMVLEDMIGDPDNASNYGFNQIVSPIIQGGTNKILRKLSAEDLLELDASMYAIGGLAVIWLAGFRIKFFLYSFLILSLYITLTFIYSNPFLNPNTFSYTFS